MARHVTTIKFACVLIGLLSWACQDDASEGGTSAPIGDMGRSIGDMAQVGPDITLVQPDASDEMSDRDMDAGVAQGDMQFMSETDQGEPGSSDQGIDQEMNEPGECSDEMRIVPDCIAPTVEYDAALCDGFDNDCDGVVDEGCGCKPGRVQSCFLGPENQLDIGACRRGTMRCVGSGETGTFGPCDSVGPTQEVCDGLDNDCNGCTDELELCTLEGECPGPGDPRTPTGRPFTNYPLMGALFYQGAATAWQWTVEGGPCDQFAGTNTGYELQNANQQTAIFKPRLSGSYRVTLTVTTPDGPFVCSWVIDVLAPGLRVEMCYPESNSLDLDLYMMPVSLASPWFPFNLGPGLRDVSTNACSWFNCEAMLRGAPSRANWGHRNSMISECEGGPQGAQWRRLGYCANPRLDIDNNLFEGTGLPENINLDVPTNGEGYRIMIQNFSGQRSRPIVNVYCGGRLTATYGAPPDIVPNFAGTGGTLGVGGMWRVAEVYPTVSADGETTDCRVEPIHPPGQTSGYYITNGDNSF